MPATATNIETGGRLMTFLGRDYRRRTQAERGRPPRFRTHSTTPLPRLRFSAPVQYFSNFLCIDRQILI